MTREEAIERLKTDIYKYADFTENPNENEFWMAFDMAIESLGQEPCEDAISRQAVIRWVKTECNPYGKPTLDFESGKKVIEHLKQMPPVTPQPKTGHWIAVENEEMETVGYYCSECDLPMETEQRTNFCPNCGTKMVKPQESEDKE